MTRTKSMRIIVSLERAGLWALVAVTAAAMAALRG